MTRPAKVPALQDRQVAGDLESRVQPGGKTRSIAWRGSRNAIYRYIIIVRGLCSRRTVTGVSSAAMMPPSGAGRCRSPMSILRAQARVSSEIVLQPAPVPPETDARSTKDRTQTNRTHREESSRKERVGIACRSEIGRTLVGRR